MPPQLDLGLLELETKDREKIVQQIKAWKRSERAPYTATALAILEAAYEGVEYVGVRGTKSHKTLQRDAGLAARLDELREPDPKKREDMVKREVARSIRVYFLGWRELRDGGVVVAERIPPRDPRLADRACGYPELPLRAGQAWAVPAKGQCVCPWHHGATVWTLAALSHPELLELARSAVAANGRMRLQRPITRKPAWKQTPQGPTPSRRRKATRNAATPAAPTASLDVISDLPGEMISEASEITSQITSRSATAAPAETGRGSAVFSAEARETPDGSEITSISGSTPLLRKLAKSSPPSPGTRPPAPARLRARQDVSPSATGHPWPPPQPATEPGRADEEVAATGGPTSAISSGLAAALLIFRKYLRASRVEDRNPMPGELQPIEHALRLGFTVAHCIEGIAEGFASKHNAYNPSRLTLCALLAPSTLRALVQRAAARRSTRDRVAELEALDRSTLPGGPAANDGPGDDEIRRGREAKAREDAYKVRKDEYSKPPPPKVQARLNEAYTPPAPPVPTQAPGDVAKAIALAAAELEAAIRRTDYAAANELRELLRQLRGIA